jgi:hypothetical protein
LTYRGSSQRNLVVEGKDNGQRQVVLRIAADPSSPSWAGLTIERGTVVFRNLHFDIASLPTLRQFVAGVLIKSGSVTFERCTFSQADSREEPNTAAKLLVASVATAGNGTVKPPIIVMEECYFEKGQVAVALKGAAVMKQINCALGRHACLFHLGGQDKSAEVSLENVSAVLKGPVFRLDDNVSCKLTVRHSIFSCPDAAPAGPNWPDLIHQTAKAGKIRYEGKGNAYHGLAHFWTEKTRIIADKDLARFNSALRAAEGGSDEDSNVLLTKDNPWPQAAPGEPVETAFYIDSDLPQLRQKDQPKIPIGVRVCTGKSLYNNGLQAPAREAVAGKPGPGERWVDPTNTTKGESIYLTVNAAISAAQPGDVILIMHNNGRPILVEPVKVSAARNVKLRPYNKDSRPVLVLDPKTAEKETALFQLVNGQIEFQDLEFLLRPEDDYSSLAVVSLSGNSTCHFNHCVITLDNHIKDGVKLDVVALLDPDMIMKTPPGEQPKPKVHLEGCFVRGDGNLLKVHASRSFELNVDKSLLCLGGSLLDVKPGIAEPIPQDATVQVTLKHVTAWMGEPLLYLRSGKNGRGLAATQVFADHCLFAAAASKPLVRLDGLDNKEQTAELLKWMGSSNAYGGYKILLEQPASSDAGMAVTYIVEDWKRLTSDKSETLYKDAFFRMESFERAFRDVQPDQFKPEIANYGADVDRLPSAAVQSNFEE